jgi:hypothetical protein
MVAIFASEARDGKSHFKWRIFFLLFRQSAAMGVYINYISLYILHKTLLGRGEGVQKALKCAYVIYRIVPSRNTWKSIVLHYKVSVTDILHPKLCCFRTNSYAVIALKQHASACIFCFRTHT